MLSDISGGYYVTNPDGTSTYHDYPPRGTWVSVSDGLAADLVRVGYARLPEDGETVPDPTGTIVTNAVTPDAPEAARSRAAKA